MEYLTTDIAVIGTGGAGMAAAITAAEAGAKVVILEKRPFPGGTSTTPMCVSITPADPESQDTAFKVHMDQWNWNGNADLVRAWIKASSDLVEWLKQEGYEAVPTPVMATPETMGTMKGFGTGFPRGYFIHQMWFLPGEGRGHGGATVIKTLMGRARDLGVEVRLATPARKLLKANGRITGVLAEDKDGNEVHVDAKAVIIAAGGFNNDPEMLKKYSGYEFELDANGDGQQGDIFWLGDFRLTGDGIKMAWEAGAAKGAMGIGVWPHVPGPGVIGHQSWNMLSQMRIIQEQPYLWVNRDGKRFIDEAIMDQRFQFGNVMAKQPGKCAYIIFDADTRRHMEEEAIDFEYFIFKAKTLTDIEGDMRTLMDKGNKHVFIAESLDGLARQMNIDPAALTETVAVYNGYCDRGRDEQYAKDPKYLRPIRTPKFYAVKVISSAYQTIGGIKVNGKTEAIGEDRRVLPGLYAAGDIIAAEMYGDPPLLGTGLFSIALATGRIAARSAVEYVGVERES